MYTKVCVQLSTSADNVPLPAYAAARRAAAPLLLTAAPPAVQQSIGIFWPPGPRQQTRSSGVRPPDGRDGQTEGQADGRTDRRTPDSCTEPAPHTIQAVPEFCVLVTQPSVL